MTGHRRRQGTDPYALASALLVLGLLVWLVSHALVLLLVLIFASPFIVAWWRRHMRWRRAWPAPESTTILQVDLMDGLTFESWLHDLFQELGYKVEQTKASHDFGADLVLSRDGVRTVVQAKRYDSSQAVGISAVEEVLGSMGYYKADRAMVVTNQYLSASAQRLAAQHDVAIMNRGDLVRAITEVANKRATDLPAQHR